MEIILYSTHCPKCKVLEKKLQMADITYTVFDDITKMIQMGFKSAPYLKVNETVYPFKEACKWADDQRSK